QFVYNPLHFLMKIGVLILRTGDEHQDPTSFGLFWVQTLLNDLKVPIPLPIIYCDNMSIIILSLARTNHMELDIFFLKEKVINKSLN
ncbi:hypothetical protein CR513_06748, partial [Mucuna pruriens]